MAAAPFGANEMRLVLAARERGTISGAALELGVSQPAASQMLSAIEAALGRRLFRRGARELTPTPDGEAYIVYARAMIRIGEDARRHFDTNPGQGSIRLGITEDIACTILPSALAMFARDYPDFAFAVECGSSAGLFAGLDAGRHEVVLAKRRAGRSGGEFLWQQPVGWYGIEDTPRPVADPVCLIMVPEPSEIREAALEALRQAGRPWRVLLQSNSVATIEAMIRAGAGISAFGRNLHGAGLVELGPEAGLPDIRPVQLMLERAGDAVSDEIRAFSTLVREAAMVVCKPDLER